MIPQSDAEQIINQVKESVKSWRAIACRLGKVMLPVLQINVPSSA